ncbi:putative beta-1,3-galactosyltransferase 20 [Triticum urartu]|uniref:Hexosyltransferase n=1 Tax=Triticum urartu TaxID=4572 RepID=M7ZV42_TRIUA|nr:putative beta-1,3-galactosyltransferase 20 [Triticum urartu]
MAFLVFMASSFLRCLKLHVPDPWPPLPLVAFSLVDVPSRRAAAVVFGRSRSFHGCQPALLLADASDVCLSLLEHLPALSGCRVVMLQRRLELFILHLHAVPESLVAAARSSLRPSLPPLLPDLFTARVPQLPGAVNVVKTVLTITVGAKFLFRNRQVHEDLGPENDYHTGTPITWIRRASLQIRAARVAVRFFFCRIESEEQRLLVALEAMRYGDVVELDCPENMDNGKTHSYFSSVPALFGAEAYDFVMKADDDTFFRLPQLAESLGRAPREDLYYGCMVPCDYVRGWNEYMSGMGYVISWDLVEWIVAAADRIRNHTAGPEDRTLYSWFSGAGKAKNRVDVKPAMYDFPQRGAPCAHELVPDTIAVHRLKNNFRWSTTLKYFNFTAGLQPSKFYRVV